MHHRRILLFPSPSAFCAAAVLALVFLPPSARAELNLNSSPSFSAAQAKAKSEKRLLFLMFTSEDCRHCKKFNSTVVDAPVFQAFARDHLAPMIYDVDSYAGIPKAEREFALSMEEKYGVEKLPAIVVFDPNGKELLKTQGYRGTAADKIVAQLKTFLP